MDNYISYQYSDHVPKDESNTQIAIAKSFCFNIQYIISNNH